MQPLDPLTVCGIGLPVSPRHLRQLPRGHHQDFAPHRFQHLVRRDPVDPCSPSPPTPRHGLAATSPCGSIPPWWLRNRLFPGLFLPPWSAHPMSFAPQINASHVAANHRQSFDLSSTACTILAIVLHPDPPFRARPPRLAFHGI